MLKFKTIGSVQDLQ